MASPTNGKYQKDSALLFIKESVEVESIFVKEALPESNQLIDITADTMVQYVKCVADYLCTAPKVEAMMCYDHPTRARHIYIFRSWRYGYLGGVALSKLLMDTFHLFWFVERLRQGFS